MRIARSSSSSTSASRRPFVPRILWSRNRASSSAGRVRRELRNVSHAILSLNANSECPSKAFRSTSASAASSSSSRGTSSPSRASSPTSAAPVLRTSFVKASRSAGSASSLLQRPKRRRRSSMRCAESSWPKPRSRSAATCGASSFSSTAPTADRRVDASRYAFTRSASSFRRRSTWMRNVGTSTPCMWRCPSIS